MKHIKQHLIFLSVLIILLALVGFTLTGCDDMQMTDVITDLTSDTRPYTRAPSLDITLDIPDDLKFKVPVFTGNGYSRFSDISHTLSQRRLAMTKDRIYVPTGSGENIYVFDYSGTFLPDETLTRPAIHSMHSSRPSLTEHKQSGDSLTAILTDGEYLYLFIVVDIFEGVWSETWLVRIHIADKYVYPRQAPYVETRGEAQTESREYWITGAFILNDMLYFKYSPGLVSLAHWHQYRPDILKAYDKITLEKMREHNIQLHHGHRFDWQIEGTEPRVSDAFVAYHADTHIDVVLAHIVYVTADATHIYLGPSVGLYSAYDLDGQHAPLLEIDTNGVVEYSPFGNAGLVNVGDRMYLPGSDSEGAVDADGNMEIKLFAFTK